MPRATPRSSSTIHARSNVRAIDLQDRHQRDVSPLELGLIEQPTRPRSEYTMGARKRALDACDGGRLFEAADLTRAAMTESGYARGILSDLTHGLWGLPRHFLGRADMISDLDDTPERVGQWRTLFPEPDAIRLMSWGITLGVGVGQMRRRYGRPGDAYALDPAEAADGAPPALPERPIGAHDSRALRTWDPKYLRCQWWDETWWLMTADGEIRITPNDGEWLLYLPYGEIKPWEYGAWKSLTLAWILERDSIFDRSRHAEVLAPVRVGTVPQGTTERQRQKFLRLIREMQRLGMFVLPPGLDYKIVESTGRVADIYAAIIEWARGEYAMITGALTTATGSAGFAKGDVQERFTRSILSAFAGSLSTCLHGGGLVPWAEDNYGSSDAPRAEWDTAAPEDKKVRAETLKTAAEALDGMAAALAKHGKRLTSASVEAYVQTLGLASEALPTGPGASGAPGSPDVADLEPGDAPPTDEAAEALAAKMTIHGIARCEHNACNRCRKCGVERLRDFDVGPDGAHAWRVAWRAIARAREATPEPAAYVNGAASRPMLSPGGDA